MSEFSSHRVLVAPLDWGLGHATRCVPVIKKLQEEGKEVILTANGRAEHFLKAEFPELEFVYSPEYRIRYSKYFPLWVMMIVQAPLFILNIYREHGWLNKFLERKGIDEVISDNRYGLWSKKIPCVFITHQLMIKLPGIIKFLEPIIHKLIISFVKKYSECWIPDVEGNENLSGELSHQYKIPENTKFIGTLSRFQKLKDDLKVQLLAATKESSYSICFILSGPEPQRTFLEKQIHSLENSLPAKSILLQGKPGKIKKENIGQNLTILSHVDDNDFKKIIQYSELIVCRAGYSSIMDLKILGKSALLIPTPGQTEQEYLAEYLSERGEFETMKQGNFSKDFTPYQETFFTQKRGENNKDSNFSTRIQNDRRSRDRITLVE